MHFSDYLNRFRIEYCERIMNDTSAGAFSFKELAFKCGFNNRNTFTTAFKKFTGKTPSEYIKSRWKTSVDHHHNSDRISTDS